MLAPTTGAWEAPLPNCPCLCSLAKCLCRSAADFQSMLDLLCLAFHGQKLHMLKMLTVWLPVQHLALAAVYSCFCAFALLVIAQQGAVAVLQQSLLSFLVRVFPDAMQCIAPTVLAKDALLLLEQLWCYLLYATTCRALCTQQQRTNSSLKVAHKTPHVCGVKECWVSMQTFCCQILLLAACDVNALHGGLTVQSPLPLCQ